MSRFSFSLLLFLLPLLVSATAIVSSEQTPLVHDPVRTMESWGWENCGLPTDALQIDSISVTPDPPKPGKDITVTVVGSALETIEDGATADVTVKLGLIKILHKTFDLCEEARKANTTVQCPLEPGPFTIEHTAALPKEIPQGKFIVDIRGYSVNDDDMLCLTLKADFRKIQSVVSASS